MSKHAYTYEYPRPAVTVDLVIFTVKDEKLHVLLIKRKNEPFKGCLAFPGGFVDQDESLEHAAERELREETGLVGVSLEQLSAFGDPGRDPRGHTVSVVYAALVSSDRKIKAGDDAATAKWVEVSHAHKFKLAFDHKKILRLAVCWEWLGCRCCRR